MQLRAESLSEGAECFPVVGRIQFIVAYIVFLGVPEQMFMKPLAKNRRSKFFNSPRGQSLKAGCR